MVRRSAVLLLLALVAVAALASSGANATRAPVADIVDVEARPFSAIVKWRGSDPGRVVLEGGVGERSGVSAPAPTAVPVASDTATPSTACPFVLPPALPPWDTSDAPSTASPLPTGTPL